MNFRFRTILGFAVALASGMAVVSVPLLARSADACFNLFAYGSQVEGVKKLVGADGYDQWLKWEQSANFLEYRKTGVAVKIGLVSLDASKLEIKSTSAAPPVLLPQIVQGATVLWPQHPFNMSASVPYFSQNPTKFMDGYLTSSRSIALAGELRGFTIKLPTDHPHGREREEQTDKLRNEEDIDSALLHSEHIEAVDRRIGEDPVLAILTEAVTIQDKASGNGAVLRDVRRLDDGHYFLPAFSIAFVGRQIAALNHEEFEPFFERNYAALLGEAKARLLLRYGLQMESPNPQNLLIEFDRNLKPTGRTVFRDVSDAYLVTSIVKAMGFNEQSRADRAVGFTPQSVLHPFWSNSSWRMDANGEASIPETTLNEWGLAHNRAYRQYIERELHVTLKNDDGESPMALPGDYAGTITMYLSSKAGQSALEQYRERLNSKSPSDMR